jgi:hypothetical protein
LSFLNKRKEGRKEERKLPSPLPPPPPPPPPPPYSQVSQNHFFSTQPASKQASKQVTAKTKKTQSKAELLSSCSLPATVAATQGSCYRNRTEVQHKKQTKLLKFREEAPHPKNYYG